MGLYHRDIYLPDSVRNLRRISIDYRVSRHAAEAAQNDRYGVMEIPGRITFEGKDVVEAEINEAGKVIKLVVRLPYDERRDAIYVVGINPDGRVLKTAWFNLKTDSHSTLRRHLYVSRPVALNP